MLEERSLAEVYPFLDKYTSPVKHAERPIVGRATEMERLMAAMRRPELCNVILIAEAGTGKTALVQGTMVQDTDRYYLEVDLSRMIADLTDPNQMADKLKSLFEETQRYRIDQNREIVLFMDEFHQIVQLSKAAVEALKPLLADSGTRGIRVIAATTFAEFRQYIAANQPLVERLQRIALTPPDKETTVRILSDMAKRYGVDAQLYNNHLFEMIYEYTNRYIPANSQPRKSILVLDSMIGWYKYKGRRMNMRLLADVIYEMEGVNIAFRVDATKIKKELDAHVFAQDFATSVIEQRLQLCVADLNDKTKPMSSFLFTGSTGVGKGLDNDTPVPVLRSDRKIFTKRNGDLKVGDYVFNRKGQPCKVTGVYHRGMQEAYKVTLEDGRSVITDSSHLWTYIYDKDKSAEFPYTNSTKELFERGVSVSGKNGRRRPRYRIPMNEPVDYPEAELPVDPYWMGAFLSDTTYLLCGGSWSGFISKNCPKMKCSAPTEKYIPDTFKYASISQRWDLLRGLFDTDGTIGMCPDRSRGIIFSSVSKRLTDDVQTVLYSLGMPSVIWMNEDVIPGLPEAKATRYYLSVKYFDGSAEKFFQQEQKKSLAQRLMGTGLRKWVAITDIEKLPEQHETTCIMVDDEEHLYQAGQFLVTHNTEVTKQLAQILFDDPRSLIRFDMTEYANESSLDHFRRELTERVWEHPYSIILLDEVEKACAPVTRILLQVLDDGRLTNENDRETSFVNAYIIMTTNAGSEIYKQISQYSSDDTGSGREMKKYNKLIRASISSTTGGNRFPPELLGRIDTIVPFQPLSEATQERIVESKLTKLAQDVREKHNIDVGIKRSVVDYIVKDNLDTDAEAGGARAVIAKLESEVTTAVARYINTHPDDDQIVVDVEGQMAFQSKTKLESDAYIVVYPVAGTGAMARR